jgi:hypothetical protein
MNSEGKELVAAAILGAEEIHDPIENLLERMAADPNAVFAPEVLDRLAALRAEDPAAFAAVCDKLARAGCSENDLDQAIEDHASPPKKSSNQADQLVKIAPAEGFFHGRDGTAYCDLTVNGHRETWPVHSKGFKGWLRHQYYLKTGGAPNSEALKTAISTLQARAQYDAPEREVHIRVARENGKIYLDLADEAWQAVEVDDLGWRIVERPPVRFCRAAGMLALPEPIAGGEIHTLRPLLNVVHDEHFTLVIGWILSVVSGQGPYPVMALAGEQGSAKSTFSTILRKLLDPNFVPLRGLPREERELYIAAKNAHILAFDNVSTIKDWISDALCRLSTGGGYAVRQLHTDGDEILFNACRPILLNGIEDVVNRADLADRAINIMLEPIAHERRRTEQEVLAEFDHCHPAILGALLDAVSIGLRQLPYTHLDYQPRMADFALWAVACEAGYAEEGAFLRAYKANLDLAIDEVLQSDSVALTVVQLMADQNTWQGLWPECLEVLSTVAGSPGHRTDWPKTPRALSGHIRRISPLLRKQGIEVTFPREKSKKSSRGVCFNRQNQESDPEYQGKLLSAASANPSNNPIPQEDSELTELAEPSTADAADLLDPLMSVPKSLINKKKWQADAADSDLRRKTEHERPRHE